MSKRATFLSLAVVLVAGYWLLTMPGLMPWTFTKETRHYQGRFFRMVVKLDYHGEPQLFDFVVGCNVNSSLWGDGSRSRDVGLIPAFYGHRMTDDKAVVIRPPDVCNGETTAGGEVPLGFMPLIIVYDNANTLDQGLAYLSDDAYDSPRSEMKFGAAEIIASTADEFEASMTTGVPNVVTRERHWSTQSADIVEKLGFKPTNLLFGTDCHYATKWLLNNAVREKVRAAWPKDKPRYWLAKDWHEESQILEGLDNDSYRSLNRDHLPDYGMPRRTGLYRIQPVEALRRSDQYPLSAFYPYWRADTARDWPDDKSKIPDRIRSLAGATMHRVLVDGESWRGFALCQNWPRSAGETYLKITPELIKNTPGIATVDDVVVDSNSVVVRLLGIVPYIFEYDDSVYELNSPNIDIMGGDVK